MLSTTSILIIAIGIYVLIEFIAAIVNNNRKRTGQDDWMKDCKHVYSLKWKIEEDDEQNNKA